MVVGQDKLIEKYGSIENWKAHMREIASHKRPNGGKGGFAANRELAKTAGAKAGKLSKTGHRFIETKGSYNYYIALSTGNVVKYKHDNKVKE